MHDDILCSRAAYGSPYMYFVHVVDSVFAVRVWITIKELSSRHAIYSGQCCKKGSQVNS